MFKDNNVKKKREFDQVLMQELGIYDWTLWQLKLAMRDLKKLEADIPDGKANHPSKEQIERNKVIQEVRNHLQSYFDRDIDTLS